MPPAPPSSTPHPRYIRLFIKYSGGLVRVGKILPLPALKPARVPRKKNGTGKKQNLEVIDPPRETHEIDEMGLAGFPYDKDFPNGPVSAADTGPGGSHASQPVRLAPGPWPLISDSPVGHHAAMPPCRHAAMPPHLPMPPAPPSSTPHPRHIRLFIKYSGGQNYGKKMFFWKLSTLPGRSMKSMKWGSLGFSTIRVSPWAGVRHGHGAGRQSCLPARPVNPWAIGL
jgi:hypothetical protein